MPASAASSHPPPESVGDVAHPKLDCPGEAADVDVPLPLLLPPYDPPLVLP